MRIPPDPMFKSYAMERHGITHAQFEANWEAACGWLSQWQVDFHDAKAKGALQLYTHRLSCKSRERAQDFNFCAVEFLMALL